MTDTDPSQNPYIASTHSDIVEETYVRTSPSKSILLGFVVWAVALGIVAALYPDLPRAFSFALNLPAIVLMAKWCREDGRRFGILTGTWMTLGLIFVFPVALVIHFLRTRGANGIIAILLAILFACLLMIVAVVTMVVAHLVLYGNLELLE